MSDVKHSLIEEAYRSAQRCYTEANETVASLDRAITTLQDEGAALREALTKTRLRADQLIGPCGEMVQNIHDLCLTYGAVHAPSGLVS